MFKLSPGEAARALDAVVEASSRGRAPHGIDALDEGLWAEDGNAAPGGETLQIIVRADDHQRTRGEGQFEDPVVLPILAVANPLLGRHDPTARPGHDRLQGTAVASESRLAPSEEFAKYTERPLHDVGAQPE